MKTKKKLKKLVMGLALFTAALSSQVYAAVPVIDTSSIAKLVQQIDEMKKQYDMLKQQYNELVATKNAVTGSYGISLLGNGTGDEQSRRALPGTWQEVVNLQKSGQIPGLYFDKAEEFKKMLPSVDLKLFSKDPNNPNATSYKLSIDNTSAAFAATEAIYNQIQTRLKTIESLVKEIDQTDNVKAATDLNSRISAENGFLSIEMARLNSLQLSLQTVLQNNQNQATARHAEFFGRSLKSN